MSVTLPPGASMKALGTISVTVKTITGAIARVGGAYAGDVELTSTAHGFSVGNIVVVSGITGTVEANGRHTVVEVVDANNFVIDVVFAVAYVAGGIATIPQDLYQNYVDLRTFGSGGDKTPAVRANSLFLQALSTNVGNILVGVQGMDRTVAAGGVFAELVPGQSLSQVLGQALNGLRPGEIRIDATTNGDGVRASYIPF